MTAFGWLVALTLRVTVVLLVTLGLTTLLGRGAALARHRLFTLTACGLLLLPVLPELLPRWEWAILPAWTGHSRRIPEPLRAGAAAVPPELGAQDGRRQDPARGVESRETPPARVGVVPAFGVGLGTAAVSLWLAGFLASLVGLVRALYREARLLAASRPLGGEWTECLAHAQRSLSVRARVSLLSCGDIEAPLTGGWRRPAVLLPESATSWTSERQAIVLQHELVHVARRDGLRQLAWRLVSALYWHHPLARLAARHAALAREEACDEAVVGLGHRPSAYAGHLLALAESLRVEPRSVATALPMVERSQLERRLLVILDSSRSRSRGRWFAGSALVAVASMVIAVGAAAPPSTPGLALAVAPAGDARERPSGSACVEGMPGDFEGTLIEGPSGTSMMGTHDGEFVVQQPLGNGQRLCARVHGNVPFDERDGSIKEMPAGSWVRVETSDGRESRRMLVTAEGNEPRYAWWRNGVAQAADPAARAWLGDALAAVAGFRQIGAIHGQVGSLQGQIGSIQGEVGSLQGEIGALQGEKGSLEGKLGSIQGELGSLQGEIGSHQGAIGSLEGDRGKAVAAEEARIDREIRSHQAAIAQIEAELASGALAKRMAAAEEELRTFVDSEGKGRIAEIERRIQDLRAEERIARIERQIVDLRADRRIAEIEKRIGPALARLRRSAQP